jgi:hypothetical protein
MIEQFRIRGGAGPVETAAILAAIQQLIVEEAASQAMLEPRNVPPAWVRAGRAPTTTPPRMTGTVLSTLAIDETQLIR